MLNRVMSELKRMHFISAQKAQCDKKFYPVHKKWLLYNNIFRYYPRQALFQAKNLQSEK